MKLRTKLQDVKTIKLLLSDAESIASRTGETEPGAEHLLAAAFDLPDGTARRAFERVGADPDAFLEAVESQHDEALRGIGIDTPGTEQHVDEPPIGKGIYRSTASAQAVFKRAGELARADKRNGLLGAHVVLAALELTQGTVPRALEHMEVDRGALEAAARNEIESS